MIMAISVDSFCAAAAELTLATLSNIGVRTNLMKPICAVGFVTFSRSMNGATGSPCSFSLSDCNSQPVTQLRVHTQINNCFVNLARSANLPTGLYILPSVISSFFTLSKAISVSTGPSFTIFSPNGRYLREF